MLAGRFDARFWMAACTSRSDRSLDRATHGQQLTELHERSPRDAFYRMISGR